MKKITLGLAAIAALVVPLAAMAAPANAANGDEYVVNGDFASSGTNGALLAPATTDFTLAVPGVFGTGNGSMYDPGTYTIGTNPIAVHEAWADFSAANDPMMIVNGFTEGSQKVWSQTITPEACTTPGSKITFDFTANATNVLRPESAASAASTLPARTLRSRSTAPQSARRT